jgi:hypothetical protein
MTRNTAFKLLRVFKRHEQLLALRHRSAAEQAEMLTLGRFLRGAEKRLRNIDKRFSRLEKRLLGYGIRMTEKGIERLH